jgi:ornithine cyclodeaminase
MATLVLTQPEIRALLPMPVCMELVAGALASLARGEAQNPLRHGMRLAGGKGLLGMMPGSVAQPAALGLKVVGVFPGNHATELDAHQGVVVLLDPDTGVPRAVLDASEITALRTAAASGVATRALANTGAGDLALLGSGVQARTHLEAMLVARTLTRVRVFSPTRAHREAFAASASERHGIPVVAVDSAQAAVEGADLVCTVTSSRTPVLMGEWLSRGCHVNAAGACTRDARELDTEAVRRARLFVDRRESALAEAGDLLIPIAEGAFDQGHVQGELGEVLLGRCAGRRSAEEVTLFESLGIAVEDLAVAHYLDRVGRERGAGTLVELGGKRA